MQATTKGLFLALFQEADMLGTSNRFDRRKVNTQRSKLYVAENDRFQSLFSPIYLEDLSIIFRFSDNTCTTCNTEPIANKFETIRKLKQSKTTSI